MHRIRRILLFSILLIAVLIGFIFYQIKTYVPTTYSVSAMTVPMFCGIPNLTENEKKGREIFNSNCAACHKKHARSTGPALENIDSLVVMKWLKNKTQKIDSSKIEKLGIDYHTATFSERLTKQEITFLIEYCKN